MRAADCYCPIASRAHYVSVAEKVRVTVAEKVGGADCYCLMLSRANHASSRASHRETAMYRAYKRQVRHQICCQLIDDDCCPTWPIFVALCQVLPTAVVALHSQTDLALTAVDVQR